MSCLPTYKGKRYNSIKELKAENNKYNGEPSLYNAKNKTAYLIKGKANKTSAIHEIFTHPFLIQIEQTNPKLYNNLLNEAKSNKDIVSHVDKLYTTNKDHEYIARAIDLYAKDELDAEKDKDLISKVKEVWSNLVNHLKTLFNIPKVYSKDIKPTTTLEELTKLAMYGKDKLDLHSKAIDDIKYQKDNQLELPFEEFKTERRKRIEKLKPAKAVVPKHEPVYTESKLFESLRKDKLISRKKGEHGDEWYVRKIETRYASNGYKTNEQTNHDVLAKLNNSQFNGLPVLDIKPVTGKYTNKKSIRVRINKEALDEINEIEEIRNRPSYSVISNDNNDVKPEISDELQKLAIDIEYRRREILNRLSDTTDELLKQDDNYKLRLEQRAKELNDDKRMLMEVATADAVKTIGERQIAYVRYMLENDINDFGDLSSLHNIMTMWKFNNSTNYLTKAQMNNPESDYYKAFKNIASDAEMLDIQILDRSREVFRKLAEEKLGRPVKLEDLKNMDDTHLLLAGALDMTKTKNPLLQTMGVILSNSSRNKLGMVNKYQDKLDKLFEHEAYIKKITGNNYDLFWDKDINGVPTGGMVNMYSSAWHNYEANIKSRWEKAYNEPDPDARKRLIHNILTDQAKNTILVDLVALGKANGERNKPGYTFKSPKEYRDYLEKQLGKAGADKAIEEANLLHTDYLSKLKLKEETVRDDDSIIDKEKEIQDWIIENSPIMYLNVMYGSEYPVIDKSKLRGYKYLTRLPKGEKFYNKDFKKIYDDPILRDFYNKHNEIMHEFINMLPNVATSDLPENFLANIQKNIAFSFADKDISGILNYVDSKFIDAVTNRDIVKLNAESDKYYVIRDGNGAIVKRIPIRFLSGTGDRSLDLKQNLEMFAGMAINFVYKNKVIDIADISKRILNEAKQIERTNNGNTILDGINRIIAKKGELYYSKAMLNHAINAALHDEVKQEAKGTKKVLYSRGKVPVADLSNVNSKHIAEANTDYKELKTISKQLENTELSKDKRRELKKRYDELVQNINSYNGTVEKIKKAKRAIQIKDRANTINERLDEENAIDKYGKDKIEELKVELEELNTEYEGLGGKSLSLIRVGEQLMKWTQLKGLGLNFTAGISNIIFGLVSDFTHANGRIDFDNKQIFNAFTMVLKSKAMRNNANNKIFNLVREYNILFDVIDTRFDKYVDEAAKASPKGKMIKFLEKHEITPYVFQTKGEYLVQSMSFIASLMNNKVDSKFTKSGEETNMYDIYKNDGKLDENKLNEAGLKEYSYLVDALTRNSYVKARDKAIQINKKLHGNYDPDNMPLMKRYLLTRMLSQFRSWLPEGVADRFESKHEDPMLGRTVKGRWMTYADLGFIESIRTLAKQITYRNNAFMSHGEMMKDYDIENMRRNLAELASLASLSLAIAILKYSLDYDDDKDNPMKIPIRILANSIYRGRQDIYTYISPGTFYNIMHDPVPVFKTVTDLSSAIHATYKYYSEDEYKGNLTNRWLYTIPYGTRVPSLEYLSGHLVSEQQGKN